VAPLAHPVHNDSPIEEHSVRGVNRISPSLTARRAVLVLALAAALVAGAMFEPFALVGTWGLVNGPVVALIVFGTVLRRRAAGTVAGRAGGYLEAAVYALVAVCVGWFLISWGIRPWYVAGGWLWPIAIGASAMAARALRGTRGGRNTDGHDTSSAVTGPT
jgi:hypothetical protein